MSPAPVSAKDRVEFPPGSLNANWFNLCNAIGFQILLGAPLILYAKSIGASSTVLGIIASFTPLMTVFQLPAAQFLPRYGYKQFVLMGWGMRTIFVFVIAVIPLLTFLDGISAIALLLACLFIFNLIRGISSCAWYPWITELIPEPIRGRFLSRDQFCTHLGCLVAMLVSALVMEGKVDPWDYSIVFFVSAIGGTVSIYFIKKIPDVPASEAVRKSSQKVPWRAMLSYPPFALLLSFNLLYVLTIGGLTVFTIAYIEESSKFTASLIMMLSSLSFVAALLSLPLTGRVIDSLGSKMVLRVSLGVYAVVILGWFLIAGNVIPPRMWLVGVLMFLSGLAAANFNLANVRMTMATMPVMGRNHFFALFTVVASLGLGGAPVLWGVSLDALGGLELVTDFITWKKHSVYFAIILALDIIAIVCVRFLPEGREIKEQAVALEAKLSRMGRIASR